MRGEIIMSNTIILKSSRIVTPDGTTGGYLIIKGEKISKITESLFHEEGGSEIIGLADNFVIPGFLDLHIHGAGGYEIGRAHV